MTNAATSTGTVRHPAMSIALSVIAGVTDVTSWLLLGGFFSAHVTGNFVVLAADAVTGHAATLTAMLAIPVFIVVTIIATLVAGRLRGTSPATHVSLIGAQAVLLTIAAILSFVTTASADPTAPLAVIIGLCAVAAMAAQNAYLHLTPGPAATTAVMTGNLVSATTSGVQALRSRGTDAKAVQRWQATWPLIVGFLAGCLIGAAAASTISDHAAVIPAALAIIVLIVLLIRIRRNTTTTPASSPSAHAAGTPASHERGR